MNILHVVSGCGREGGGTSEVVPRICRAQRELGHQVTLAILRESSRSLSLDAAERAGVRIENSSLRCRLPFLRAWAYSSTFRKRIAPLVAEADIVHLHGLWQWPAIAAGYEALRQGKPYVVMTHGFLEPERLKISPIKKRIVGRLFDRKVLERANAIVVTAEREAEGVRAYGLMNRICVMPLGLDMETVDVGVPRSADRPMRTVLYFSRITPIKGLDLLAAAWAKAARPGWRLLLVGPDDRGYAEKMKRLYAETCRPDAVEFRGPVYGEEKRRLLASVDGFVLPTRNENWGVAVAEAMATGLPVVCTKGAPWSVLNEIGAGWWVDVSVEGISAGLRALMGLDDAGRRAMGEKGRRWVKDNLSWPTIASKLVADYAALIGR